MSDRAVRRRRARGRRGRRSVEWPTLFVAATIYAGWLALTFWHAVVPWPILALAGGWLIAWQGSLQHETIHGHPTRFNRLNWLVGFPPLSLWLPYAIYRRDHVAHHASAWITHPAEDPESRYLPAGAGVWAWLARLQQPLVGRLLLGPAFAILKLVHDEAGRLARSPRAVLRDWAPHVLAVAGIVAWLEWTGLGLGRYLALFVYPAAALTLLRSFVEHRADIVTPNRAATVERGGPLGLLFLNNHFHAAHHERPDLAWYTLPAYQRHHAKRLTGADTVSYRSYGEIVRRFAFQPHDRLYHPATEP